MAGEQLFVIHVALCEESRKTFRVLNDRNPDLYPVLVYFNRHIDEFERKELADFGIVREDGDGMCALIDDTTLEQIRDRLAELNKVLASAVERARQAREEAAAEDQRLTDLAAELNKGMLAWEKERLISPRPID
jgi:hypothetical protein